ncbi:MAG TPA: response regulator [Candidatus Acidoferrales bacterium]|nr:response regulator [Candidatus Acidoferrales bacterium]
MDEPKAPTGWTAPLPGADSLGTGRSPDAIPDLIFCCDADGTFAWASSSFEMFAGYRPGDLIGQNFAMLLPSGDRVAVTRFFLRQLRRRRPQSVGDYALQRRDGGRMTVTARVRLYERPGGERYFVGVARERQELEAAPAAAGSGPETAELDARLRGLKRQLEDARAIERLRGEVLATLSQELRPPMNSVLGTTAALLQTTLDGEQRRMVEQIQLASQALLSLVSDAYDHARLESGRLEIESIEFDLRVTLEQVHALLAPLATSRGLTFEIQIDPLAPSRLKGDPGRLRQVLINLAGSALRSADRGAVTVAVQRESEDDGQVTLVFRVADPGIGRGSDRRRELFRDQPDPGSLATRGPTGSELGLSIARRLVHLMDGEVGIEEGSGHGGEFWFRVRFQKQPSRVATDVQDVRLRGVRVLVADGMVADRRANAELLAAWGCEVEQAENGIEALDRLRAAATMQKPFTIALADLALEGLDAEALASAVRTDETLDATTLVLTTRVGRPGDAVRARELGFSAYLLKPIEPALLYDAFRELLATVEATGDSPSLVTRHSIAEARRGRVRILLVEADAVNLLVTQSALHRVGFQVEIASSGHAAIARTESERWDLVLIDLNMPDLDGVRATRAIRARERAAWRTPILGLVAADQVEAERERCIAAGMDDVFGKPIDLAQLSAAVERYTLRSEGVAPAEPAARTSPSRLTVVSARFDAPGKPAEPALPEVPEGPAVDLQQLNLSSMGLPALRTAMLHTYLGDVFPRLRRLEQVIESGDCDRMEMEAHGLKGMCSTIGASGCTLLFGEMERRASEGRPEMLRRLLPLATREVQRTEEFIRRLENIVTRGAA